MEESPTTPRGTHPSPAGTQIAWQPAQARRTLRAAADIAGVIATLPAVATLDWCDRAALCLARVARPCLSVALVGTLDAGGGLAVEAAGAASLPTPARNGGPGEEDAPARAADDSQIGTLRSRLDRLNTLGAHGGALHRADPSARAAADLAPGQDWRAGPLGRLWHGFAAADVLLGRASIPGSDEGRSVVAIIALTGAGAEVRDDQAALLESVLPSLARRAALALGLTRATPSQWLTSREQEVLDLLTLGRSVKEIAESTGRSPHTVHDHVKSLHKKLHASTRGELVARALGHIAPPSDLDVLVSRLLHPRRDTPDAPPRTGRRDA